MSLCSKCFQICSLSHGTLAAVVNLIRSDRFQPRRGRTPQQSQRLPSKDTRQGTTYSDDPPKNDPQRKR